MTPRIFALLRIAGIAIASVLVFGEPAHDANGTQLAKEQAGALAPDDSKLRSELLFDLVIEKGSASNIGPAGVNRVVVPVTGGTFDGPRLKGTLTAPSGDWIAVRPDGSSVLDLRLMLLTDDMQKIYMTCRGIAYTPQGGALEARILSLFETGAPKYSWLNNVVAVGVFHATPGKIVYRVYRIL